MCAGTTVNSEPKDFLTMVSSRHGQGCILLAPLKSPVFLRASATWGWCRCVGLNLWRNRKAVLKSTCLCQPPPSSQTLTTKVPYASLTWQRSSNPCRMQRKQQRSSHLSWCILCGWNRVSDTAELIDDTNLFDSKPGFGSSKVTLGHRLGIFIQRHPIASDDESDRAKEGQIGFCSKSILAKNHSYNNTTNTSMEAELLWQNNVLLGPTSQRHGFGDCISSPWTLHNASKPPVPSYYILVGFRSCSP